MRNHRVVRIECNRNLRWHQGWQQNVVDVREPQERAHHQRNFVVGAVDSFRGNSRIVFETRKRFLVKAGLT